MICSVPMAVIMGLSPCRHEEADTRLLLQVADMANKGHNIIFIRTVDTDVVVLAIAFNQETRVDEMWIGFGTEHNFQYISAQGMSTSLGPLKSMALPFLS